MTLTCFESEIEMPKELKKLMKKNHFEVIRMNKHIVWQHKTGGKVTTSATPSCKNAIRNIMKDIKNVAGVCYA
jgi:hypothetical protein